MHFSDKSQDEYCWEKNSHLVRISLTCSAYFYWHFYFLLGNQHKDITLLSKLKTRQGSNNENKVKHTHRIYNTGRGHSVDNHLLLVHRPKFWILLLWPDEHFIWPTNTLQTSAVVSLLFPFQDPQDLTSQSSNALARTPPSCFLQDISVIAVPGPKRTEREI